MSYFSLIYGFGINANLLHLTFSREEFYLLEAINKLTIYAILFQNVTIFYLHQLASLIQVQEKLKACCFIADDSSHINIV